MFKILNKYPLHIALFIGTIIVVVVGVAVAAIIAGFGLLTSVLFNEAFVPQGLHAMTWTQGACLNLLAAIFRGTMFRRTKGEKSK